MALFQVEGWDIKQDKVALGGKKKSKKEKKLDKAFKNEVDALKHKRQRDADGDADEHDEVEEEPKRVEKSHRGKKSAADAPAKKRKVEEEAPKAQPAPVAPMATANLTPLQKKMMAKLSGSRFRWINEQLYTTTSQEALRLLKEQPELFDEYHQGFRSQVQSWPENPVDVFVEQIKTRATTKAVNAPGGLPGLPNKKIVIADMGCGEAQLALDVNKMVQQYNKTAKKTKQKRNAGPKSLDVEVHSFDLKKHNDRITVADIKNVPLPDGSCTVVIFCLALMGTNFIDFINEAYRLLTPRGELWIAEIKSRFAESASAKSIKPEDVGADFVEKLKLCGFFHKKTDNDNKMFTRFEFFKPPADILAERNAKLERRKKFVEQETEKEELEKKRAERPEGEWLLKPCIYKRR
ncbi:uncharacterized protein CANTADRAFT_25385 [Suhomyces tanzawaensis NRRL Y-17324]|uniref:Ribosomal RNA-processing protein 8 n=1 Tax=Suhomyces tanzawaensis NRRL Y-17324 TaxID=984487 RepID=A0A1E4SP44_9ASCO|nr:uncharacterized protein CANTADRAFT_25385 [Suhomyces tanzawaensis NRRL Y-17324]ODV81152.1 hypothetical protein CANTADRAFT_25385 [Suhomyces tanzawaensis NRRL Y-17324]